MVAAHPDRSMVSRALTARIRAVREASGCLRAAVSSVGIGPLVVWPAVVALGSLIAVGFFGLPAGLPAVAVLAGISVVAMALTVAPRKLKAAEARAGLALARALEAETSQRARADELADVLRASEGLVLLGEGRLDFVGILAAVTPVGASSYLEHIEGDDAVIAAAHGPLAPWFIGLRRRVDPASVTGPGLCSYSAAGRAVGERMPSVPCPGAATDLTAALAIRFSDHSGRALGWLHLIDPTAERILEPAFVSVAQLVANQMGVATENKALLTRAQNQLAEMSRVQQQLVQVAKLGAVGELAAAVAHEVNNPLTGILGFAELLLSEIPEDDPRNQEVAVIRSEAVRARSIVRSLLEFARPRPPQRVPTQFNALVRSAVDLVRFRADEASVWLTEDYGALPDVEVDPDAFRQVLLNLMNNAVEAMPRGGELRVSTRLVVDRIALTVSDSGVGMDAGTRDRVFSPFFTTRPSAGGTGLGLSVSLQIVEGHGGSIEVSSEPGRGSVFTVWLPVAWHDLEGQGGVGGLPGDSRADTGARARRGGRSRTGVAA